MLISGHDGVASNKPFYLHSYSMVWNKKTEQFEIRIIDNEDTATWFIYYSGEKNFEFQIVEPPTISDSEKKPIAVDNTYVCVHQATKLNFNVNMPRYAKLYKKIPKKVKEMKIDNIIFEGKYKENKTVLSLNLDFEPILNKDIIGIYDITKIPDSHFYILIREQNIEINPLDGKVLQDNNTNKPDLLFIYQEDGIIKAKSVGSDNDNGVYTYYNFDIDSDTGIVKSVKRYYKESGIINGRDNDQWPAMADGILKKM